MSDDGLPAPISSPATGWTKESGPGEVIFDDAGAVDTAATFTESGTYVLRLTADDGEASRYDELTVTVIDASSGGHVVFDGGYQNGWYNGGLANTTQFNGETVINASSSQDWSWHLITANTAKDLSNTTTLHYEIYFNSSGGGSDIEWHSFTPADEPEWGGGHTIKSPVTVDGEPRSLAATLTMDTWHMVEVDLGSYSWWSQDSVNMKYLKWQWPQAATAFMRNIRFTSTQ